MKKNYEANSFGEALKEKSLIREFNFCKNLEPF
jgi:hypothetical protein